MSVSMFLGADFKSGRLWYQPCLVVLPGNVGFWGLSLALVATRGHGRLLDGAGPQKPLRRERSFLPAPSGGWMGALAGWAAPGGGCRERGCCAEPPRSPTAHKQAWKARSPQQQVQHEVRLCPAPKAAARSPQPELVVSRSQSPLPPVTWGGRVPPGPRSPVTSSPEGSGRQPGASPHREPAQPRRVPSGR